MIRFTVLGSGSTGNCVLITSERTKVLVDAGLSAREILRRLAAVGVDPAELDGVLLTHEHGDHAGGLRVLLSHIKCPLFISGATADAYVNTRKGIKPDGSGEAEKRRDAVSGRTVEIVSAQEFRIGDIDFEPFAVPHDAADNFGFVASREGVKIATLMDFGCFTELINERLRGCDAIIIESNHSRDMLRACSVYSWDLKQRIASRHGHLSNEALADWLAVDFDGSARHLVLTHLSQRANEPHLARITAETALMMRPALFRTETKVSLSFAKQPTDWIGF